MRRADKFTDEPGITPDGGHIPATLHHLATTSESSEDPEDDILSRIASTLSALVPVRTVHAVRDDVRQLFSLELEEPDGVRLRANSISDGTLRFLALTAIAEAADAGVYCMEEPENGIHPERLEAMNRLLHDIAVDPDEPVAEDNPLRQVIVATHSPYFVQLQSPQEIVLAKNTAVKSATGSAVWPLKCYPLRGSWRDTADQEEGFECVNRHRQGRTAILSDSARKMLSSDSPPSSGLKNSGRMEAWLLADEASIRRVAGRPRGTEPLDLPAPDELESVPDPKRTLRDVLMKAGAPRGVRRRKRFKADFGNLRKQLAENLPPGGLLEQVPAWARFRDDVAAAMGKRLQTD